MKRRRVLGLFAGGLVSWERLLFSDYRPTLFERGAAGELLPAEDVVVKIIGTAQDGGIPQIGCDCPNCSRARKDPAQARMVASLAILDFKSQKILVVDATPDIRAQFERARDRLYERTSIRARAPQGIVLSHAHIGHYPGLIFFGFESIATDRLPVYCSSRMKDFLASNGPWSQLIQQKNISAEVLTPSVKRALTPQVSVIPLLVPHRDEFTDTLGLIFSGSRKKILYIPDIQGWASWGKSIAEVVEGVDVALLDGTFYGPDELPGRDLSRIGHPFIKDTMDLLREEVGKGKQDVYFTHFNHSNPALDPGGEARKSILEKGFLIAEEGLEITL